MLTYIYIYRQNAIISQLIARGWMHCTDSHNIAAQQGLQSYFKKKRLVFGMMHTISSQCYFLFDSICEVQIRENQHIKSQSG